LKKTQFFYIFGYLFQPWIEKHGDFLKSKFWSKNMAIENLKKST